MPEILEEALALAAKGYYVLPIKVWENANGDHEKMPLIKWGSKASANPDDIRAMPWEDATHVAVACEPSGMVVVDIDPYHDENQDRRVEGDELFGEWVQLVTENSGDEFNPPWVTTISEGVHAFFRADPTRPMSNSAKDITHCIDIRGIGGLVVIYFPADMWESSALPMMPGWLYDMAQRRQSVNAAPVAPPEAPKYGEGEAGTPYGLKALKIELDHIQEAWDRDDGHFNEDLNRFAYAVGQLAGGGELEPGEAHDTLRLKLAEIGAPTSQNKTLDSGFTSGYDRPRSRKTKILEETEISDEEIDAFMGKWKDSAALDQMPPPRWLIPGWLELNSMAQMVGPSRSGKSFIALDVAARLSRGLGWPAGSTDLARPVRVAYIVAESLGGFAERKRAWETQHGPVGELIFYPESLQIMAHEWRVAIEAFRRWQPALVIVDTQARCTVGVNENEAREMGQMVDRIDQLIDATGACVLLVHHTSKMNESARGSNAVLGALETEIMVTRTRDGRIKVDNTKQKNDQEAGRIFFDLCPAGPSVVPLPSAAVITPAGHEGIQRSHIKMQVRQFLMEQHVPRDTNEIFEGIDAKSRPRVVVALNELVSQGEVTKTTEQRRSRNCSVYLWSPPS